MEMRAFLTSPSHPRPTAQPRGRSMISARPRPVQRAWASSTATFTTRNGTPQAPIQSGSSSSLARRASSRPPTPDSPVAPLPTAISCASMEIPVFASTSMNDPSRKLPAGCTCMTDAVSPLDTRARKRCAVHFEEVQAAT